MDKEGQGVISCCAYVGDFSIDIGPKKSASYTGTYGNSLREHQGTGKVSGGKSGNFRVATIFLLLIALFQIPSLCIVLNTYLICS